MIIVDDIEQGSQEWHKARLAKITGSRVQDVLSNGRGNAPSKTADTYMFELIAEALTGETKPFFENDAMRWGTDNEDPARSMYELINGVDVRQIAYFQEGEHLLASPDGLVGDDGLIEIKAPNTTTQLKRALSDNYSEDYTAQIQFLLWLSGRDWCDFVSFDPRLDCAAGYLQQRVFRDEEYISKMEAKVNIFIKTMQEMIAKLSIPMEI